MRKGRDSPELRAQSYTSTEGFLILKKCPSSSCNLWKHVEMCWRSRLTSNNGNTQTEVHFSTCAFSLFLFLKGSQKGVYACNDPERFSLLLTWIHHHVPSEKGRFGGQEEEESVSSSQVPRLSVYVWTRSMMLARISESVSRWTTDHPVTAVCTRTPPPSPD